MRIVIDLQVAQGNHRVDSIGLFSLRMAQALAEAAKGKHEILILLNAHFSQTIESIRQLFCHLLPSEHIRVFDAISPAAEKQATNAWRRRASEILRKHFVASLNPDIVYIPHFFEGFDDDVVLSSSAPEHLTVVGMTDSLPCVNLEKSESDAMYQAWTRRQWEMLEETDQLLAFSQSAADSVVVECPSMRNRVELISVQADDLKSVEVLSLFEKLHERNKFRAQPVFTSKQDEIIASIAQLECGVTPNDQDLILTAKSLSANTPKKDRHLLVDVTSLAVYDGATGVQRVIREVTRELLKNPPSGYLVKPVYYEQGVYHEIKNFTPEWRRHSVKQEKDTPIEVSWDDIFFGISLDVYGISEKQELYVYWRNKGIQIYFVVYDLLPVLLPHVFQAALENKFSTWLKIVYEVSTGLICISESVAQELYTWLSKLPNKRCSPLLIGSFSLGTNLTKKTSDDEPEVKQQAFLSLLRQKPSFLMVATIEPRKNHAFVLEAFEQLWHENFDVNLVFVGQQGWMVDALIKKIKKHGEYNKRLFWMTEVSDSYLNHLYQSVTALIAASEGEGFGLPLIEAAYHRLPVIARDIPIFREVAGDGAYYFKGQAAELVEALKAWLVLFDSHQVPDSSKIRSLSWKESVRQLEQVIFAAHWSAILKPGQFEN